MFRSPEPLAELYPLLLRHGAYDFSAAEVMRFLGRKLTASGGIRAAFHGEVVSDVARRADHLRIKHRVDKNWNKMYDRHDKQSTERYLHGLAQIHASDSLGDLTKTLCRSTKLNGKLVRALQPWSPADAQLLDAVSRPEFALNGFRNRDLRPILFGAGEPSAEETRPESAKVSRQLRLLRAPGLILKVQHIHRYLRARQKGRRTSERWSA